MRHLAVLLALGLVVGCNKELAKNPAQAQQGKPGAVKQLVPTSPGGGSPKIGLEVVDLDPSPEVVAHGYAYADALPVLPVTDATQDKALSEAANEAANAKGNASARATAREHLSYALLQDNVSYQRLFNTYELHVGKSIQPGENTVEPFPPNALEATAKGKRSDAMLARLRGQTFYRVKGEAIYSATPTEVGQYLPLAQRKAYQQALMQAVEAFAAATKITSGTMTVGQIVTDVCEDGTCRVELAVAVSAL